MDRSNYSNYSLCVLSIDTPHSVDRTIPLAEAGFKIYFIASKSFVTLEKLKDFTNVEVIFWNEIRPERKRFRLPLLINLIRDLQPDALIVHFCGYDRFQAAIFSGIKPVIGMLMGSDVNVHDTTVPLHVRLEMLFTRLFLPYVELLAAKTNQIKDKVLKWGLKGEIICIPWGVKVDKHLKITKHNKYKLRKTLKLPEDSWIILSSRTVAAFARISEIIEGFASFHNNYSKSLLLIIENNPNISYLNGLKEKVGKLGLKYSVLFIPKVPKDEIDKYYLSSDVFISNVVHDGMPQSYFEAGLCETPLLLSDLPQYHDYFTDGISAIYFDGSPNSIAAKLEHLYFNKELCGKLGQGAREVVIDKADFDKWSKIFISELSNILKGENRIPIPKYKLLLGRIILLVIILFHRRPFSRIHIRVKKL